MKSKQLTAVLVASGSVMLLVGTADAGKHRGVDGRSLRVAEKEAAQIDYFEALLREPLVERSLRLDFDTDQFVGFSLVENNRTTALLDFEVDAMTGTLRPVELLESQSLILGRDLSLLPLWLNMQDQLATPLLRPLTSESLEIVHDDVSISISRGGLVDIVLWHHDEVVGAFYAYPRHFDQMDQQLADPMRSDRTNKSASRVDARYDASEGVESVRGNREPEFAQQQLDLLTGASQFGRPESTRADFDISQSRLCSTACRWCTSHPVESIRVVYCAICESPACN